MSIQAHWLHCACGRVLRSLGGRLHVTGNIPTRGLLVANHLGYLDIIVLAALTPCVFVAKSEVQTWPVFGWFARRAGTIFVQRDRRRDAARSVNEIRAALNSGALVVLFPEGTSSDGSTVLPFKSALLEAALGEHVFLSVAAVRYGLSDGDPATDVCYWGSHTLVPHLLKLMSKRAAQASVAFAPVANSWRERKKLALHLHEEVSRLHAELLARPASPSPVMATAAASAPSHGGSEIASLQSVTACRRSAVCRAA